MADEDGEPGRFALARTLLKTVVADPARLPENCAAFALRTLAPAIPADLARTRERHPETDTEQLAELTVTRGVHEASTEGAAVAGPLMVLIPVAFCAALLAQIKMVLRLAAVAGLDPTEPVRAAEVLTALGVYRTVGEAASALAAAELAGGASADPVSPEPTPAESPSPRPKWRAVWDVTWRMARLLGIVTPAPATRPSWPFRIGGWLMVGLVILGGMLVPFIWLPYLAYSYRQSTRHLAERASVFYLGSGKPARAAEVEDSAGIPLAVLRAVGSVLLAVGTVVLVLVFDFQVADHSWLAALLGVLGLSLLTGVVWWLLRSFGRRRVAEQ
jgi:hypothetical protein